MRTNSYPGKCNACGAPVAASAGYLVSEGSWRTYCATLQCLPEKLHADAKEAERRAGIRELNADGDVITPYEADNLPLIRSMPGSRFDRARSCWTVSTALADRPRLLELADRLKLDVAPELRVVVLPDGIGARIVASEAAGLYPFQLDGVRFLCTHDRALLGDDMGLGKTVQALLALPQGARAVAVVPSCVKINWRNECRRWRPDLRPVVLKGRGSFQVPKVGELVILNPEILPEESRVKKLAERLAECSLIADEVHLYKNFRTRRYKRVKALAGACRRAWAMTGTPLLNKPFDLYGVLQAFSLDRPVFGGWRTFIRLFNGFKDEWGGWHFSPPGPEVAERLRRVMLRRTKAEVLPDLPPKCRSYIEVNDLPAKLRRRMDEMLDTWGDVIEGGLMPPFEEFSAIREELARSRVKHVCDMVEPYEDAELPVVVFSAHRAAVEALGEREGWGCIIGGCGEEHKARMVDDFQAGRLKGLAGTIGAAGVGITLTASSNMIFVDRDWVPASNLQAEDRICRIGQDADVVSYTYLTSDHPLDRRITALLEEKERMITAAIELVAEAAPAAATRRTPGLRDDAAAAERIRLINRTAEEVERDDAKRKLSAWVAARPEVEAIDDEAALALVPTIERGFERMLGQCDGAVERDGVGFNKPDAFRARWIYSAGFDHPDAARAGLAMLRGYSRQLRTAHPELWKT